jgi:hypothetical protein
MSRPKLPKFRAYLDAIRPRKSAATRLKDAKAAFGDLDRFEGELRHRIEVLR